MPIIRFSLSLVGTFEYDAVATIGLLACEIAPQGPLPANFSAMIWARMVEQNTSSPFSFDGLTGKVRFDSAGNRDLATVSVGLANWILPEAGGVARVEHAFYTQMNESVDRTWIWISGSREASSVLFTGGRTQPPIDEDLLGWWAKSMVESSATVLGILLIVCICACCFYRRLQKERRKTLLLRLRRIDTKELVKLPKIRKGGYHIFLSHVWYRHEPFERHQEQGLLQHL